MDEQERINETEGNDFEPEVETSADLATPVDPQAGFEPGHPESAESSGPYVSEDGR